MSDTKDLNNGDGLTKIGESVPLKVKVRRHGSSLGINLKKEIVEQLNICEGEEILILLSKDVPSTPLEEDFIRWQKDIIKKEILKKYNERYQKNRKLFQQWYKERVENVDFFAFETVDKTIEIPSDDEFAPPKPFRLRLKENKTTLLPYKIALKLEKGNFGKIVRKPPKQEKWSKDFSEWLKERKRFETFLKLHPNMKEDYRREVKKGKMLTYDEYVESEYERWKTKKIDF